MPNRRANPGHPANPQTGINCDSNFGYVDTVSYEIRDQLTTVMTSPNSWNEKFTSSCSQDNTSGNWCTYGLPTPAGDNTISILVDYISGPGINNSPRPNPAPVCVGDSTKQEHYNQEFWVGNNVTVGSGVRVQTNQQARYTNHGEHQNVVSPAP